MWRVCALVSVTSTAGLVSPQVRSVVGAPPRSSVVRWSTVVEKESSEEEKVLTIAEEEATLVKVIEGSPRVGVLGFFEESRTDQFVLDVLHAQGTWGEIVAFASEPAAAKKKLMSRSARYSGLLDVLKVESKGDDVKAMLDATECGALLAFGASDAAAVVKAADESASCERVVVVTMGSEVPTIPPPSSGLEWSVIALDASALDDRPEGGPIAVDRADDGGGGPVSRHDAYRIAAEALLVAPLTNKAVKISEGNEYATQYLRHLREKGYSRRAELAKIANGELVTFEADTIKAAKIAEEGIVEMTEEQKAQREREIDELIERRQREREEERAKKVAEKAREYLGRMWSEKKYTSARGLSREEYIRIEWETGVVEAAAILGYSYREDQLAAIKHVPPETEDDDEEEEDEEEDD